MFLLKARIRAEKCLTTRVDIKLVVSVVEGIEDGNLYFQEVMFSDGTSSFEYWS